MTRLVVRTGNALDLPLLDTDKAERVEIYGDGGQLAALLVRLYGSPDWGLVERGDGDWADALIRFGVRTPESASRASELAASAASALIHGGVVK